MHASASFLKKRSKKLSSIAAGTEFERRIQCHPKRIKVFWFFFAKKNALLCFVSNGLIYLGRNKFIAVETRISSSAHIIYCDAMVVKKDGVGVRATTTIARG